MNRSIISALLLTLVLDAGCTGQNSVSSTGGSSVTTGTTAAAQAPVVPRDISITRDNAFNDLFLDSTAIGQFIVSEKLNDNTAAALRNFYSVRNYEFAWFNSSGMIEQAFNFHSLSKTDDVKDVANKFLDHQLDKYRAAEDTVIAVSANDVSVVKTELQLTTKLIQDAIANDRSYDAAELAYHVPVKRMNIYAMADSVLADNDKNRKYDGSNTPFRQLRGQLKKYVAVAKNGGWKPIPVPTGKKVLRLGSSSAEVPLIKDRLRLTGELAGADTSKVFDATLQEAVKTYQLAHGQKPTGEVGPALIKDFNITADERVQQLLINIQRMHWMPTHVRGRMILVNIPEFELYVDSGGTTLFNMDVVVGKEGHNTTMFSGNLNQVVFSPYWNVPPSIVRKEILPAMKRNKNYLASKDMEVTGQENGLPVIRQRPGPKCALGRVKFIFPNSQDIYLHDTPDKNFFNRSARGLSHGCVRLSDPVKMANYLLQDAPTWTPEKIDEAMNSGKQQFVRIKSPVPVMITYYTAWTDGNGVLHFADDIYGHDRKMAAQMFTAM